MNVRIEHTMSFIAGVYYDGNMKMNNYTIRLYMVTNTTDSGNQNIAFERMRYFVYEELDSVIFVNEDETETCQQLMQAGLKIATLPAEPVDQIIGMMLYSKLGAIMENRIIINEIEISSSLGENITYLHSADEGLGPLAAPGWWLDADLVHCNDTLVDDAKVVAMHRASAWRELDLAWSDLDQGADTGNTIVFADFKKSDDTK
jgi:hypothetical protein